MLIHRGLKENGAHRRLHIEQHRESPRDRPSRAKGPQNRGRSRFSGAARELERTTKYQSF